MTKKLLLFMQHQYRCQVNYMNMSNALNSTKKCILSFIYRAYMIVICIGAYAGSVDQDQTAQKVQSDLRSALSAISLHIPDKTILI